MSLDKATWDQLKNLTADRLIKALLMDGWEEEPTRGAPRVFYKGSSHRVVIHYHPKKTYGPKCLKGLLNDIRWSEDDLLRLKLIKQKRKRSQEPH